MLAEDLGVAAAELEQQLLELAAHLALVEIARAREVVARVVALEPVEPPERLRTEAEEHAVELRHMSRDWVTFDCYGTLADWLGGMRNALTPHVGADDAERLLHAYHDLEAEVEAQRPGARLPRGARPRRCAARPSARASRCPPGAETALVDHWHELPIFDDVGPALGALRERGWSLAILSNCDDDLLATTLERMPVPFDLTVTAEQVGSYKPGHRPLARASRSAPTATAAAGSTPPSRGSTTSAPRRARTSRACGSTAWTPARTRRSRACGSRTWKAARRRRAGAR